MPVRMLGFTRFLTIFALLLTLGCATSSSSSRGDLKVSDSWITTRAENEVKELGAAGQAVRIRSQNGVLYLEGQVKSVKQAEQLEQRVSKIRGVREVKNNLVVRP